MTEQADLSFNALWLRDMREKLGWSTTETAEYAREAAADLNEEIRISQQIVSAFEMGKHKATPRWLGYVQIAMSHHLARKNLPAGRVWEARLPTAMTEFFADRRASANTWGGDGEHEEERRDRSLVPANDDDVEIDAIDLAYGMGGAFLDTEDFEVEKAKFSRGWLRQFTDAPPELLFSAQGIGDSMWPTIHDRDVVIVDRSGRTVDQADKIWAVAYGGVGMIKRLRPLPDGTVRIMSDNPQVSDELATDGDLHIVGRVAAIVRRV